jgi:hypothetical protein
MTAIRVTCVLVASLLAIPAQAQPTCELPVSAFVTDTDGSAIDGVIDVELRFYLEARAGAVPTECRSFSDVTVTRGWIRLPVDACSAPDPGDCGALALSEVLREADGLWVGVMVGGVELEPRIPIGAVPFAVHAADARALQGNGPEDFEPAGSVDTHAGNPDIHHSSTSDGIAITPSSVTIGETILNDGGVDLGADVDDQLTAEIVRTLTGGGDADALHEHPAGHGEGTGGCYTAWGVTTCGDGYSAMYSGVVLDDLSIYSSGISSTPLCVADSVIASYPDTVGYLTRQLMTTGAVSGSEVPALTTTRLLCAICCQ